MSAGMPERNQEIGRRRRAGETYRTIAESYGIGAHRARMIAEKEERRDRRAEEWKKILEETRRREAAMGLYNLLTGDTV